MAHSLSVLYEWRDIKWELEFTCGDFILIHETFGKNWNKRLNALFTGESLTDFDFIGGLAVKSYDPAINIPKAPFINSLYAAYNLSWYGREPEANDDETGGENKPKKPRGLMKSLKSFFRLG